MTSKQDQDLKDKARKLHFNSLVEVIPKNPNALIYSSSSISNTLTNPASPAAANPQHCNFPIAILSAPNAIAFAISLPLCIPPSNIISAFL